MGVFASRSKCADISEVIAILKDAARNLDCNGKQGGLHRNEMRAKLLVKSER
jgi:hypothetical protein